jgi:lipoprotein NlpI
MFPPVLRVFMLGCALAICCAPANAAKAPKSNDVIASKEFSYRIAPPPAFVMRTDSLPAQTEEASGASDAVVIFNDHQTSVEESDPQEYTRFATKPLTESALRAMSQIYLTFNPAYQKLTVHTIRIWRDGKAIDMTHKVKLDLMRRENNLENNLYEGNVTAVGILPDMRIGDVIDLEYTISGRNPIFGKRYSGVFVMTQMIHTAHYRFALTAPTNRTLKVQAPVGMQVKESKSGQSTRYVVESTDIKPMPRDDGIPPWYQAYKFIQVSEYQDWAQVGQWANDLFKNEEPLSPELQEQVKKWKESGLTQEQLTVEALRWVQSQIRYFGIELGVNSHLPSPPNRTFERKFGDCKDKSLLLATLLKALDIPAEPTLASISFNRNTEKMLPSASIFDHAIVRVQLNGKTYWLDPSLLPQYGNLDKISAEEYGGVLVLGDNNSTQLQKSDYPPGFDGLYQKTSRFTIQSFNEPVRLSVQIKATMNTADGYRQTRDSVPKNEFDKSLRADVLRMYPSAKPDGDIEFSDDRDNNQVTITANFLIEDFFQYKPGWLSADFLAPELLRLVSLPTQTARSTPFMLYAVHSHMSEIIEMNFPDIDSIKTEKSNSSQSGKFWNLSSNGSVQKNKITQNWTVKANRESVSAQEMSDFVAETQDVRKKMGISIQLPVSPPSAGDVKKATDALLPLFQTYGKSKSDRVAVEVKDVVNLITTSNDIASGKLSNKALAEAYKLRSQAYDDRGDVPHALEDIRLARKLVPEKQEYLVSEADTLLGNGQMAEAGQLYEQVIQANNLSGSSMAETYWHYGQDLYYLGQNSKAKEMLDESLRHGTAGSPVMLYAAFWRYIAASTDADASSTLESAMNTAQEQEWPYPVGDMMLGKITPEQLLEKAGSDDKGIQADQYCEAYFYIGKKYQLAGNKEKANESFQKSIDQGVMPFVENNFSLYELGKKKVPKSGL